MRLHSVDRFSVFVDDDGQHLAARNVAWQRLQQFSAETFFQDALLTDEPSADRYWAKFDLGITGEVIR
jgi:hypothetical protein